MCGTMKAKRGHMSPFLFIPSVFHYPCRVLFFLFKERTKETFESIPLGCSGCNYPLLRRASRAARAGGLQPR